MTKKPTWNIEFEKLAEKELKKLKKKNPKLLKILFDKIATLKDNPLIGEELAGDLLGYRKLKVKSKGGHYRIVYQVIDNEVIIVIVKVNKRENFYKDLKNYLKTK